MGSEFKFRYVNQIVGSFVVIVVVLLVGSVIMIGNRQYWFEPKYDVTAEIPASEIDGLQRGTEVHLLGDRIGAISDIDFTDEVNKLRLTLRLQERFHNRISGRSVAEIKRRFAGAGEAYIDIVLVEEPPEDLGPDQIAVRTEMSPTDTLKQVVDNVRIVRENFVNLSEAFVPAAKQVQGAADEVKKAATQVSFAADQVKKTGGELSDLPEPLIKQITRTSDNIELGRKQFDTLAEQFGMVTDSLVPAIDEVRKVAVPAVKQIQETAGTWQKTGERIHRVLDDVEKVTPHLPEIAKDTRVFVRQSREITTIVRREVDDLPGTVNRVNNAVDGAQSVIDGMKRHWLLRPYIDNFRRNRQMSPSRLGRGGTSSR